MRKVYWTAPALVVLTGLIIGMIYRTRRAKTTVDVTSVEKDIRDHISLGSSKGEVESYLDQRGIQHSYIDQSKGAPEYERTETAMIRGASHEGLVRRDIQILFKFDDQGRLIHYTVKEILTGP
jgi:hypothetical protein